MVHCPPRLHVPLSAAAELYEKQTGQSVELRFNGSGHTVARLLIHVEGDLVIASEPFLQRLDEKGLLHEKRTPLVALTPVIAVAKGNPKKIYTLQDLQREDVSVCLVNPALSSMGKVAQHALMESDDWEGISARVDGQFPIPRQSLNAVAVGSFDATIGWRSAVLQQDKLEPVKSLQLEAFRQTLFVARLRISPHADFAESFASFLLDPMGGRGILRDHDLQMASPAPMRNEDN